MFEGKKILILDLIIFLISFIFIFWVTKINPFLDLLVWISQFPIWLFHEFGHNFICAVGGGFPAIAPGFLEGQFLPLVAWCYSFGPQNPVVISIGIIFGLIFNCILVFLLFYFATATNEKNWNNLFLSFFISLYAWIAVDALQDQIYRDFLTIEDIPKFASFWRIPIDMVVTFLAVLSMLLIVIAIRYGLEEEQKSGKINVKNLEILPIEITYADLFKFLFFIFCAFIGVSIFVIFLQPNIVGIIIVAIMIGFAIYFRTVYRVGNKFRYIISNIKTNVKELKTKFNLLSAVFQCTTEKNVVFSITYNKEGWVVNVPSKDVSVKLPPYIKAEDITKRINRIFTYHKLR